MCVLTQMVISSWLKMEARNGDSTCILCGNVCNEATDSISSIERWENIKTGSPSYGLVWTSLAISIQVLIGSMVLLDIVFMSHVE